MKNTGIIRTPDSLGRIVIPIELRREFDIHQKDTLEIFTENNKIILRKYECRCCICNKEEGLIRFEGKFICKSCIKNLKKITKAQ